MRFIRRTDQLPEFAERERRHKLRYPHTTEIPEFGAKLRYRIQRVKWYADEEDAIHRYQLFAWLMIGRKRLGAFELWTYDPSGCGGNWDFCRIMDIDCEWEARLSVTLCSVWTDIVDVALESPIIDYRCAWIAPSFSRSGLFAAASDKIIDEIISDYSILVMLAFPLEYEGNAESAAAGRALEIRKRAMLRYYKRIFEVELLPGAAGKKGWLWRANLTHTDMIERPKRVDAVSDLNRRTNSS